MRHAGLGARAARTASARDRRDKSASSAAHKNAPSCSRAGVRGGRRCSSMAPRLRSASELHNALPEEALRVIMLALPVDARARAACVCRGWRAFLADPSLWQVLDLTPAGGVAWQRVTENLVRGALRRAAGKLRSLSFIHVSTELSALLLDLIESNGAELQQVSANVFVHMQRIQAVCAAAPRLQALNIRVSGTCQQLLSWLRNFPPVLRIQELRVHCEGMTAADSHALAAAMAAHEPLKGLTLTALQSAPGLNALMNVAVDRRFSRLTLTDCVLDAETVPLLARLLQRGSLIKLEVACAGFLHAQEASTLLCAALRTCRTLTQLELQLRPPNATGRIVTELLDAAASLPALSVLDLSGSRLKDDAADAGRALGALLAANMPSLRALRVKSCRIGDEGMAALLDGLAANTHLRRLGFRHNNLSDAFKRDRLEPALAALTARRRA